MSASIRLPWRPIARQITANPSTHILRARCSATLQAQPHARRHATTDSNADSISKPAPPSPIAPGSSAQSPAEAENDALIASLSQMSPSIPSEPSANTLVAAPLSMKEVREAAKERGHIPRAVAAAYLKPLKRQAEYGVPSCNLQLRAFNPRNLDFFCDFALRAAYYLNLPATGPQPLPRLLERWTVPRGSFRSKKSQENFERKTLRRVIQIKDGHPEVVQMWLAFLQKHAYYGIAMKANVWEFSTLHVGAKMTGDMKAMKEELDTTLDRFAFLKRDEGREEELLDAIHKEDRKSVLHTNEYRGYPKGEEFYDEDEDDEDDDEDEVVEEEEEEKEEPKRGSRGYRRGKPDDY